MLLLPSIAWSKQILVLGDSLSAAYGMPAEKGWVSLLQQRIDDQQPAIQVTNASISGETTSGGINRLPDLLQRYQPDLVLIELGANDGLRGTPLPMIRQNLVKLVQLVHEAGAEPMLVGVRLPPNYGPRYSNGFFELFESVAQQYQIPRVPFLMEQVALDWNLMQSDGLHPNEAAQPKLLETVWPHLQPLLTAD